VASRWAVSCWSCSSSNCSSLSWASAMPSFASFASRAFFALGSALPASLTAFPFSSARRICFLMPSSAAAENLCSSDLRGVRHHQRQIEIQISTVLQQQLDHLYLAEVDREEERGHVPVH